MLRVFSGLSSGLFRRSILVPVDRHAVAVIPEYARLEFSVSKMHPVCTQEDRIGIRDYLDWPHYLFSHVPNIGLNFSVS